MAAVGGQLPILDRFPVEILQHIFFESRNPELPSVSKSLKRKLCDEYHLQELIISTFWRGQWYTRNGLQLYAQPGNFRQMQIYSREYVDKWNQIRIRLLLRHWMTPHIIAKARIRHMSNSDWEILPAHFGVYETLRSQNRPAESQLLIPIKLVQSLSIPGAVDRLHRFLRNYGQIYEHVREGLDGRVAGLRSLTAAIESNNLDAVILLTCTDNCFGNVCSTKHESASLCHAIHALIGYTGWITHHEQGENSSRHTWHRQASDVPFPSLQVNIDENNHILPAFETACTTKDLRCFKYLLATKLCGLESDARRRVMFPTRGWGRRSDMKNVWKRVAEVQENEKARGMENGVAVQCRRFYELCRAIHRRCLLGDTAHDIFENVWGEYTDTEPDDYDGSTLVLGHRFAKDLYGWGALQNLEVDKVLSFDYEHRLHLAPNSKPHSTRFQTSRSCIVTARKSPGMAESLRPRSFTS